MVCLRVLCVGMCFVHCVYFGGYPGVLLTSVLCGIIVFVYTVCMGICCIMFVFSVHVHYVCVLCM